MNSALWISTQELVWVTDKEAPLSTYWTLFRQAAEEMHQALGRGAASRPATWKTDTFEAMKGAYINRYPEATRNEESAIDVLFRYHQMKVCGCYVHEAIELFEGPLRRYWLEKIGTYDNVNGNHRMMAALYLRIPVVPVLHILQEPESR